MNIAFLLEIPGWMSLMRSAKGEHLSYVNPSGHDFFLWQ
jgi:hypothetical protein